MGKALKTSLLSISVLSITLVLMGCNRNPLVNEYQTTQEKNKTELTQKEQDKQAATKRQRQSLDLFEKSDLNKTLNKRYVSASLDSKYATADVSPSFQTPLFTGAASKLKSDARTDALTNGVTNYLTLATKKKVISSSDKLDLLSALQGFYAAFTRYTNGNATFNYFGAYQAKAELVRDNPHMDAKSKATEWTKLKGNLDAGLDAVLFSGSGSGVHINPLSDDSDNLLVSSSYSYLPLIRQYQLTPEIVAALNFEEAMVQVMTAQKGYIETLESNGDVQGAKNWLQSKVGDLFAKFNFVTDILQTQADSINSQRQQGKNDQADAEKWNQEHGGTKNNE